MKGEQSRGAEILSFDNTWVALKNEVEYFIFKIMDLDKKALF